MSSGRRLLARLKRSLERTAAVPLNGVALPLSRLSPRRRDLWLFGNEEGWFGGNAKYLALWLALHRPDIETVWISNRRSERRRARSAGVRAFHRWSPQGVRAALRAGVFLFCHGVKDTNLPLSGGALLVNLWHGVGLKPVMLGDRTGVVARAQRHRDAPLGRLLHLEHLTKPDLLIATSEFTSRHFAEQFGLPIAQCPPLGYSRLDCHFDPALEQAALAIEGRGGFDIDAEGFAETYLYLPTFRDTDRSFAAEAFPDIAKLSDALRARNAVFFYKFHPKTRADLPTGFDNVRPWPDGVDLYAYLDRFTGLITDYSSILYDFLLVKDRGAILYVFDRETYLTKDRPLLYDFDDNVAGLIANSFEELCEALRTGAALTPPERLTEVRRTFWGDEPRIASPRIVAHVEALLSGP